MLSGLETPPTRVFWLSKCFSNAKIYDNLGICAHILAKPVIFGPTIQNAHEASLLVDRGDAKLVQTAQERVVDAYGFISRYFLWVSVQSRRAFLQGELHDAIVQADLSRQLSQV